MEIKRKPSIQNCIYVQCILRLETLFAISNVMEHIVQFYLSFQSPSFETLKFRNSNFELPSAVGPHKIKKCGHLVFCLPDGRRPAASIVRLPHGKIEVVLRECCKARSKADERTNEHICRSCRHVSSFSSRRFAGIHPHLSLHFMLQYRAVA